MKIGPKKNTTLGCVSLALIVWSASCTWLHQSINIEPEALPQFESQANFTEIFAFLNQFKIIQLWENLEKRFLKRAKF